MYVQGLCPGVTRTRFLERAGMTRFVGLLEFFAMTPDAVAAASLKAMHRKRGPIVVPGLGNKGLATLFRLMPRRAMVHLVGALGEWSQRET